MSECSHWGAVGRHNYQQDPLQPKILDFISSNFHATTCNVCLSLVTAYTHATLAFYWPRPKPTRCFPFSGLTYVQCLFPNSFCWFYSRPEVSVNNIRRVYRRSMWYITIVYHQHNFWFFFFSIWPWMYSNYSFRYALVSFIWAFLSFCTLVFVEFLLLNKEVFFLCYLFFFPIYLVFS